MSTIRRIIPVLVYEDIPAAHDFLVDAFGFEAGGVHSDGEGRPVHGEVSAGDLVIWLHRVTAEHGMASPRGFPAAASQLVVMVDDVDAHFARARAAGAVIDREPEDMPYAQREYSARDPEGHRWSFATPLPATSRVRVTGFAPDRPA
ncbi:MAG TPA: VOC family protein [Longimicrobium sp.]|nr:VOC family protein [Longimicrobium sp.]